MRVVFLWSDWRWHVGMLLCCFHFKVSSWRICFQPPHSPRVFHSSHSQLHSVWVGGEAISDWIKVCVCVCVWLCVFHICTWLLVIIVINAEFCTMTKKWKSLNFSYLWENPPEHSSLKRKGGLVSGDKISSLILIFMLFNDFFMPN